MGSTDLLYVVWNITVTSCNDHFAKLPRWWWLFVDCVGFCFFLASEADRVRAIQAFAESRQLERGFKTVETAQCTNPADAERIRQEIQPEISNVDTAISVL